MTIVRALLPSLVQELKRREISIILGPRQVGKSFLLKQLEAIARKQGYKTAFYNLELPHDLRLFNQPDEELFNLLTRAGGVVFIDEFHYLKNASRLFKAVYDSGARVKIVCSGSSSIEIHRHLKESLAGRRLLTMLPPLTMAEFRQKDSRSDFRVLYREYVTYGALPGLIHVESAAEKLRLLNEMLSSYIQKDIKSLIREENIRAFNTLLYLLAERQGSLISVNSLAGEIGLTAAAVNHHLSILEGTYVAYSLHSYARNIGNELRKSRKIYLYDLGIRNALLKDFSAPAARQDQGTIHESYVFHELRKRLEPNMELKLWRTKAGEEIDFVLLHNRRPLPIEVKTGLVQPEIPKPIRRFLSGYPESRGAVILSEGLQGQVHCAGKPVLFRTFAETADIFASFA
jgi:hypothetical protein